MKNLILLGICLLLAIPCGAEVIYVDADATGANTGSSWDNAYNFLQDALADANSAPKPAEIRVAQGIYTPDSNSANPNGSADRNATFQLINGVTIKGGYAGTGQPDPNARDIELYETILSGDLNGDDAAVTNAKELLYEVTRSENSYHVVKGSGTDLTAVMSGCMIVAGNAYTSEFHLPLEFYHGGGLYIAGGSPKVFNCKFRHNAALMYGGGVYLDDGSAPMFVNCIFSKNSATDGGGLNSDYSSPTIIGCEFMRNAVEDYGSDAGSGAGIYLYYSNSEIVNCQFRANSALVEGGGICNYESRLTMTNCTFSDNLAYQNNGGGIYNYKSSPTLINCLFSRNEAYWQGGGMCNYQSNPTLKNCTFTANDVMEEGSGMCNTESSPTLTNCVFAGNYTTWHGGGMSNLDGSNPTLVNCTFAGNEAYTGGGMDNWYSNPMLTNCTFSGNHVERSGGGMYNGHSSPTLINCTFSGNLALEDAGGIYNYESSPRLTNCVFSSNHAGPGAGGAIYNWGSAPKLTNCTFAENSANNGDALACYSWQQQYPSNLEITNCILWDAGNEIYNNDSSTIIITYSDVQGGWPGDGNIDDDPFFVDPGYWDTNGVWVDGDYHLLPDSPCIDAGDPNYVAEPNETDLDGKPRVIGGRIDMGAYEYSPSILAEVRIVPRTINLASKGKRITCYIWLPEDYDVADIDPNSILLENEIKAESLRIDEQQQVAIAKFNREELRGILNVGDVELTITGQLTNRTVFEGTDVIRVLNKAGRKPPK